jgi:type III pantothenate kinase
MILTVDVGNTNTVLSVFDGDKLRLTSRINTDTARMADQYAIIFVDILRLYKVSVSEITGGIISSVVPPVTRNVSVAIKSLIGAEALIVGPGVKTGLNIKIDNPAELGGDLVCGAVAAKSLYPSPCIVVDLGTVTKVMAIDNDGALIGGVLSPGVGKSFEVMADSTALLPLVGAGRAGKVIGTNTTECITSGILYGTACMIDGLIERFEAELGESCRVVATGGFSELIAPYCKRESEVNATLVSQGLMMIYERNR